MNGLAVLGAALAAGCDLRAAAEALSGLEAMPGRGRRHQLAWRGGSLTLIDESYNASPPSMAAAFAVLAAAMPAAGGRRVAVLGDMLELGDAAGRLHRELAGPLDAAGVDRVFLVGSEMAALDEALPEAPPRRLVALCRSGYPTAIRFPSSRRRRDGQRLLRGAPRPHCRAACGRIGAARGLIRCSTRCSIRSLIVSRLSTCSATSPFARAGRSSPHC